MFLRFESTIVNLGNVLLMEIRNDGSIEFVFFGGIRRVFIPKGKREIDQIKCLMDSVDQLFVNPNQGRTPK